MDLMLRRRQLMRMQNETKNLISLAWPKGVPEPTTSRNVPRTFTPQTYVVGLSITNAYHQNYSSYVLNHSVSVQNGVSFKSGSIGSVTGYGIGFVVDDFEGGRTYDVTYVGNAPCAMIFYGNDGTYLSNANASNRQVIAPSNAAVGILCFHASALRTQYTVTDIIIIKVKEN